MRKPVKRAPEEWLLCVTRKGVLSTERRQPMGGRVLARGPRKALQNAVTRCVMPQRHNPGLYIVPEMAKAKSDEDATHQALLFADRIQECLKHEREAA